MCLLVFVKLVACLSLPNRETTLVKSPHASGFDHLANTRDILGPKALQLPSRKANEKLTLIKKVVIESASHLGNTHKRYHGVVFKLCDIENFPINPDERWY